ncbi:50S ribosomal protein L7Ae domain protein [Veillonella sp. DNF00869]|nr:50S ribosomal protein L7Ae domain protein [Veillonella sp. DNF00869]
MLKEQCALKQVTNKKETHMTIDMLSNANLIIGAKQTRKAVGRDEVECVFVGLDSDDRIILPILEVCLEHNVPVDRNHTMEELGQAAHIKVGAAAIGVLR